MWLHFGFGRIGKALIAPFLNEIADYEIVDRNYNSKSEVSVELIFPDGNKKVFSNIHVSPFDKVNLAKVNIISTSVIVSNIYDILPKIQKIIDGTDQMIAIVPFENSLDAAEIFKNNLSGNFIVLDSVVDKIVSRSEQNKVFTEEFSRIKIDSRICEFIELPEKYISKNILLDHKIKFYLLNGIHAFIAYLGIELRKKNTDIKYIEEVLCTKSWFDSKDFVVESFAKFMKDNFNLSKEFTASYIEVSIKRFAQPLKDEIDRVGRNPVLKLSDCERLEPIKGSKYMADFRKTNL